MTAPVPSFALDKLPCANVYGACSQPGTMSCSACRLVSYCSASCQKTHWKVHKRACKDPMRSKDWLPVWIRVNRSPRFTTQAQAEQEKECRLTGDIPLGYSLWGSSPAVDVINLDLNEKDATMDFKLAFPACGDFRNVLKTVNSLPSDYSGDLTILINDNILTISARHVILLILLGTTADESLAADLALHFWYSAFVPVEYKEKYSEAARLFLDSLDENEDISPPVFLGPSSNMRYPITHEDCESYIRHCGVTRIPASQARGEYFRIMHLSLRRDYFSKIYYNMRPSHRVGLQEYRRTGVVLPFGADLSRFSEPNSSLFFSCGCWFQSDTVGWSRVRELRLRQETTRDCCAATTTTRKTRCNTNVLDEETKGTRRVAKASKLTKLRSRHTTRPNTKPRQPRLYSTLASIYPTLLYSPLSSLEWGHPTPTANPLHGWDPCEVIATGKAHGANPEDVYGCLYFFLTEQLRQFHRRLRQFNISFKITSFGAPHLAKALLSPDKPLVEFGLPSSIRFDRIMVSNIFDEAYVGLKEALVRWGPFLSARPQAILVGYFLDWFTSQRNGRIEGAPKALEDRLLRQLSPRHKVPVDMPHDPEGMNNWMSMHDEVHTLYKNSEPFATYLRKQGLESVLRQTRLMLKEHHTIVPHRYGAPMRGSSDALPEFVDDDAMYYNVRLSGTTWGERSVEFSRSSL